MENLYCLVYTSSRRPKCTDEEIVKILDSCKRNNPGKSITGVLLHSEKRFLQYIEGDKNEIYTLFERIKTDERHGGVNQREFAPIEKRIFPSWHMGFKDVSKQSINFNTAISEADKNIFKALIEDQQFEAVQGVRVLKTFFDLA